MNKGIKIISSVGAGVALMIIVDETFNNGKNGKGKLPVGIVELSPTEILDINEMNFSTIENKYETQEYKPFDFSFDFFNGFGFDFDPIISPETMMENSYNKPITPFDDLIRISEIQNGIPIDLLHRLLYQESRFRNDVIYGLNVSSKGAQGIAQLMPQYHPDPRIYNGEIDANNPLEAIPYAALYLKFLYNRFNDWGYALAAYNYGETIVNTKINQGIPFENYPTETKNYVSEIIGAIANVNSVLV